MHGQRIAFKLRLLRSVALVTTATLASTLVAQGAPANTTAANVNLVNLLSPYLALNSTTVGQTTLTNNLQQALSINNGATLLQEQTAISDKSILNAASNTSTLSPVGLGNFGVAANLAGGLPAQTPINGITPQQPVGGLGSTLGPIYQTGVANGTSGPLAHTVNLLVSAYNFTSGDLGIAKNYFANGTIDGTTTAVAPAGYNLPTFNGLPNKTDSVYDLAYGVTNQQPGQDIFGSSRPVQVTPSSVKQFDPTALAGLATNPSFPSGHTTYAYTDSLLLAMLVPQEYQSMLLRGSEFGNSRIALGVHYPLDIIASRSLASYDLAQAFTNPNYINNAATTGTAINLPNLYTQASGQIQAYLSAQCGASVATCAASTANTTNDPYAMSAANQALYTSRLTYGLPTLTLAQAPQEAAPAGGPDASILLAPVFGGSTSAALAIAPNGGLYGSLQTSTINQIIVNTETNALAAFYGTSLSYWTRINLVAADGYFQNVTGTLTLASSDKLTTDVTIGNTGVLFANGAIAGQTTVTTGGTLSGSGAVGSVTVNSGGILAPGAAGVPGTLTANGAVTFGPGSIFAVRATPTTSDSLVVNGTAALNGGTVQVTASNGTFNPFTRYTILNATGGVTGSFADVTTNLAFLNPFLSYDADDAYLTLDRNDVSFGAIAATPNQARVGNAVAAGSATTQNAGAGALVNALTQLSVAQARAALDGIGGEGIAAAQNAAFQSSAAFMSSISDEQNARRLETYAPAGASPYDAAPAGVLPNNAQGYAPVAAPRFPALKAAVLPAPNPWHAWGGGFGGSSNIDGSARQGTARQNDTFYGGLVGVDYRVQPNWLLGAAVGGSQANFNVPNRATNGSVTGVQGGVYSAYGFANSFYLQSSAVLSGFSNDTHRTAGGFGGLGAERENGSYDSFEVRVRGEVGKRFDYGTVGVTPFAAVEYANLQSDGFIETSGSSKGGPGTLGLDVSGRTTESLPVFVGARFDSVYAMGNGAVLRPSLTLAYIHEFSPTRNLVNSFLVLPSASFLVEGARPASDALQTKAGFELGLRPGVTLFANFDGEFSGISNVYAGKGGLRVDF